METRWKLPWPRRHTAQTNGIPAILYNANGTLAILVNGWVVLESEKPRQSEIQMLT